MINKSSKLHSQLLSQFFCLDSLKFGSHKCHFLLSWRWKWYWDLKTVVYTCISGLALWVVIISQSAIQKPLSRFMSLIIWFRVLLCRASAAGAAERARVVEEFWNRKRDAQRNKARGQVWLAIFSLFVCSTMDWHCKRKLAFNLSWEEKGFWKSCKAMLKITFKSVEIQPNNFLTWKKGNHEIGIMKTISRDD